MDWTKFNNHGESNNHAFEVMCNLIFESWCREIYQDKLMQFAFVNGNGGDGGKIRLVQRQKCRSFPGCRL